jgi:hypothetical protein
MNNVIFLQKNESVQYLNGKGSDMRHLDGLELIQLHEVIQTNTQ